MKNPKDIKWRSLKYRRFIRENLCCEFCDEELINEKESYQGHHHSHSGGKKPSDQLIVPMCIRCHNEFHANESRFNEKHNMDEQAWLTICAKTLSSYATGDIKETLWIVIEALRQECKNKENKND